MQLHGIFGATKCATKQKQCKAAHHCVHIVNVWLAARWSQLGIGTVVAVQRQRRVGHGKAMQLAWHQAAEILQTSELSLTETHKADAPQITVVLHKYGCTAHV